jgi:hypothetical protein
MLLIHQDWLNMKQPYLLKLFVFRSISTAAFTNWSTYFNVLCNTLVPLKLKQWTVVMLLSATADFSDWRRHTHIRCSSHLPSIVLPLVWVRRRVRTTEWKGYRGKVQRTPVTHISTSTWNGSSSRTWHQHGSLLQFQWHLNIGLNIRICGSPCKGNKWSTPKQQ